ncbi:hypothetical protein GORHZ_085_00120 [Gordonia rhizosphera NBRC 16068]|uniref:Uncharacterized protein n=1 Tax=Gordonia rhizosphera NBRC 16068 TaxID=1108045 RepID=K6VTA4_9ACTN|nr:hypothetical protein GORHZ_085_00120 [Gordonia rhizosphera NBRC 16068]
MLPAKLSINAWTGPGTQVSAEVNAEDALRWSVRAKFPAAGRKLGPEIEAPEQQWWHEQHGWGVVLPEPADGAWSHEDKAWARDAPPAVQRLVQHRLGEPYRPAPVFRFDPALPDNYLRRYFPDGTKSEPKIGQDIGLSGKNSVPRYLLIVADPEAVPWRIQYALAQSHHVGRLDLDDEGLSNYVDALLSDWADCDADPQSATVWSVDLQLDADITREMRRTIAHPVYKLLNGDTEIGAGVDYLSDDRAVVTELVSSLRRGPALVVTTSHGKTSPIDEARRDELAASLGVLVDCQDHFVDGAALDGWDPNGAIWYAHACCSAGCDHGTKYKGLLTAGDYATTVVEAVAALPAQVAPLPASLLGRPKPLRAFIGQVEPTFDWTLRDELNRQPLTTAITKALYNRLYQPWPVGFAFDPYFRSVGELYTQWVKLKDRIDEGADERIILPDAARVRLTAVDRESLVVLGDPTATLPPLPSKRGV